MQISKSQMYEIATKYCPHIFNRDIEDYEFFAIEDDNYFKLYDYNYYGYSNKLIVQYQIIDGVAYIKVQVFKYSGLEHILVDMFTFAVNIDNNVQNAVQEIDVELLQFNEKEVRVIKTAIYISKLLRSCDCAV